MTTTLTTPATTTPANPINYEMFKPVDPTDRDILNWIGSYYLVTSCTTKDINVPRMLLKINLLLRDIDRGETMSILKFSGPKPDFGHLYDYRTDPQHPNYIHHIRIFAYRKPEEALDCFIKLLAMPGDHLLTMDDVKILHRKQE